MVMNARKNEGDAFADAVTQNTDERDAECTSQNISQKLFLHTFMRQLEDIFCLTPRKH